MCPIVLIVGSGSVGTSMTEALHVYEGILTIFQVVRDRVSEALAPFKITSAQFGLLRLVGDDEVVSLTELARRLGCTNANVTRLVENMVKAGLVEKLEHPSDQRIAPIRPTAMGAELRDAASAAFSRAVGEFVSQLGEEERSALLALRSRLGSVGPERVSRPVRLEPGSADDRKGRLFLEGAVVWAGRRGAFLVVVGDDYASLDTEASGAGLRFLVEVISDVAGPPAGPPEHVAVSHISDMPGEGPVQVHWRLDAEQRARHVDVLRRMLAGSA